MGRSVMKMAILLSVFVLHSLLCIVTVVQSDATVCTIFEYQCPSGKCIPTDWRCNGQNECADGADELLCSSALPKKITQLTVLPNDKTSVIVTWVARRLINSPPTTSFQLNFKGFASEQHHTVHLSRSMRSYVVNGLRPLGFYEFSIRASNRYGAGPMSDSVLARVGSDDKAESLLQATPMNSSAIMLTWTNPNEAPVLGYFVQYRNVMEGESLLGQQYTVSLAQSHRKAIVTKGVKAGRTYRITVQAFTTYGYSEEIGPVLVKVPSAAIQPPDFAVQFDESSLSYDALLSIGPSKKVKGYAFRFGKSFTKSLPVINEKVVQLPADFTVGTVKIDPFLWHYFGVSAQGHDGRWSRESFQWLRGPQKGYTGFSSTPDSVVLLWSPIDPKFNTDYYVVSFKASDELVQSDISVHNDTTVGYARIKIGSLREDTVYDFEISNEGAKCDKWKTFNLSVKTKARNY